MLVSFSSSDKACSSVFEFFEVYPVPVLGDYKGYYYSSLQFSLRVCSAVDRMDQYVFFFSLFRAQRWRSLRSVLKHGGAHRYAKRILAPQRVFQNVFLRCSFRKKRLCDVHSVHSVRNRLMTMQEEAMF